LISLFGSTHIVSGNKLANSAVESGTNHISLTTVSDSLIANNHMSGGCTYGINSGTTTTTSVSIVNNELVGTVGMAPIYLNPGDATTTTKCLIMGNKLLYQAGTSTSTSTIGVTPASGVYNTNTIGVNAGLTDTRSVPACDFLSAYDTASSVFGWRLADDNPYWTPVAADTDRYLYMPIKDIPNGAQLASVDLFGANEVVAGTWTATIYKFSNSNYAPAVAISAATNIAHATGDFTQNIPTTSGAEVINHYESSYFLVVLLTGTVVEASNAVYGGRFTFRY
jgi:hypothetical protein